MSHAEIWDDSALVDSWNEALEEYKHYHSIHAKGEKVEDAIRTHTEKDKSTTAKLNDQPSEKDENDQASGSTHSVVQDSDQHVRNVLPADESSNKPSGDDHTAIAGPNTCRSNEGPSIPQHLIGSIHDEGMKNLLMSWYYAGYYTGLYEGQQQNKGTKP